METCDLCKGKIENGYSIPLDQNWKSISGWYCCKEHALYANRYVNTNTRTVFNWEERAGWIQEKEYIIKINNEKLKK